MRLPYFELQTVLFPHLPLPLHVFEERYRAMTRDVLADGSPYAGRFVVAMTANGTVGGLSSARERGGHVRVGTIAEVRSAERLADGRWILLVAGVARAALGNIDEGDRYPIVEMAPLPEIPGDGARSLLVAVQSALDAYLATVKRFVATNASGMQNTQETSNVSATLDAVLKPIRLPDDPVAASYAVGGLIQVELSRKQQLLELPDGATRLRAELDLLRREATLLADDALPPVPPTDLHYNPN